MREQFRHFKHVVKVFEKPNDECQCRLPPPAIFDINFGSRSDNPSRRLQQDSGTPRIYFWLSDLRYRTTMTLRLDVLLAVRNLITNLPIHTLFDREPWSASRCS